MSHERFQCLPKDWQGSTPLGRLLFRHTMSNAMEGVVISHKRHRSSWVKLDEPLLYKGLEPHAEKKIQPAWKWDCSHYEKPLRHTGPDRGGAYCSLPVLWEICSQARNGYPSLSGIRNVLIALDNEHDILEGKARHGKGGLPQFECAQRGADGWKKMCKDILDMKKNGQKSAYPELQKLIDFMQPEVVVSIPGVSTPSIRSESDAGDSGAAPSFLPRDEHGRALVHIPVDGAPATDHGGNVDWSSLPDIGGDAPCGDDDDGDDTRDDVVFVKSVCMCPICRRVPTMTVEDAAAPEAPRAGTVAHACAIVATSTAVDAGASVGTTIAGDADAVATAAAGTGAAVRKRKKKKNLEENKILTQAVDADTNVANGGMQEGKRRRKLTKERSIDSNDIPIAPAIKGKQKLATTTDEEKPRRRVNGKKATYVRAAVPAAEVHTTKKAMNVRAVVPAAEVHTTTDATVLHDLPIGPYTMVHRNTVQTAVIYCKNRKQVASVSAKKSSLRSAIASYALNELNNGTIVTKQALADFIQMQIDGPA